MVKRYKLLVQEGYSPKYFKKDVLYKPEYKGVVFTAKHLAGADPDKWEEITYTELPKYWVVQNDGSKKYTTHLKEHFLKEYDEFRACTQSGYYGYDNTGVYSGTHYYFTIKEFRNNPVELSLEEFIKLTTKKEDMSKKIIGYKLNGVVSAEVAGKALGCGYNCENGMFLTYNHAILIARASKMKVLDLWFDAVYEDEYKVGDWVVGWHNSKNSKDLNKSAWKIHSINGEYISPNVKGWATGLSDIRKATPEEIAKATIKLPVVCGYEGELLSRCGSVKYGCKTISTNIIKNILEMGITSLTIDEEFDIYKKDMLDIIKYVDNQ